VAVPEGLLSLPLYRSLLVLAMSVIVSLSIAAAVVIWAGHIVAQPVAALARALGDGRPPKMPPHGVREADEAGEALSEAHEQTTRREGELIESEERYRRVFEHSPLGILILTAESKVRSANPAMSALLGYSAEELIGKDVAMFTHPEDRTKHAFEDLTARGWRVLEKRFLKKDGTTVWLRLNVGLYESPDGTLQFIDMVEDITLRALAEEARDEAEERLRHAQKIEAIGQLTGGIAHDFNNLLLAISLSLEGLQAELAGERSAELLHEASDATAAAQNLTSQLLAFGRRQSLNPTSFDVGDAINAAVRILRRTLTARIEITVRTDGGRWPVLADRNQFKTALINLAINARDAMPGGGTIEFAADNIVLDQAYCAENPSVQPGEYVMIAVSDTGSGMSSEIAERAFEPFFTTKAIGEGTGLGLSQVHGYAKQSGGHVKIYSELGYGTTLKLFLPRSVDDVEPRRSAPLGRIISRGTGTILLVEDTRVVRTAVKRVLTDHGFDVIDVGTGQDAMSILEGSQPVDILFTDMILPGPIGGAELSSAAARLRPGLRILLTSGFTTANLPGLAAEREGIEIISKPYAAEVLLERIYRILAA
jgi:PAS domain S-box-containing protein